MQVDAWSRPWEFITLSFPTSQTLHGHPMDFAVVAWVDSTTLLIRCEAFLYAHDNPHGVDMVGLGDPRLVVVVHNPLDTRPNLTPTILRGAFKPARSPTSSTARRFTMPRSSRCSSTGP